MDHRVFRDRAERHELSGVYLFEGQEEYLKEETLAFLRQNLLEILLIFSPSEF